MAEPDHEKLQIHLVLSGHYSGEGRRRDLNSCGQPVHQVLADYQSRANGGDGWLRYMTFNPTENTIDVKTYSPKLNRFESDANSEFTLDFDMGSVGANQAPTVDSAVVTPNNPKTNDSVNVAATASDPEGTTPTLSYQWQINTGAGWADIGGETASSLDLSAAGNGDKTDQVRVKVTASDGSLADVVYSNAVTVGNSAPVADNDTATTPKRTAVAIDVLNGDSDADGDSLSVTSVSVNTVGAGSASVISGGPDDGKVLFTPDNAFDGDASLTYTVSDGTASDTANVTVTVNQDATPPGAPTDVTATAVTGGVDVDWTLSASADVAGYDVFRGPTGCDKVGCATKLNASRLGATVVTYQDTTATPGESYVYFVRATDDSGNYSAVSNIADISIGMDCLSTEWKAEYFDGRKLAGRVVASECVSAVNYRFGKHAPPAAPSVGATNYSIRFTQV
ncbi:MAG: Ig-like domain-containing protein, partial [Actinomycetes bacterium]